MKLTDEHKAQIELIVIEQGGPHSAIDFILSQFAPLNSNHKRANELIFASLDYICQIRHTDLRSLNNTLRRFNLQFFDGKFCFIK